MKLSGYVKYNEGEDQRDSAKEQIKDLLQNPAHVAPVDTPKFAQRMSEILAQALRRKGLHVKR